MKNEISGFFKKIQYELDNVITDARTIINTHKVNDTRGFAFLNIIYEFIKEEKINLLTTKLEESLEETNVIIITNFIKDEQMNIIDYFGMLKFHKEEEILKLVDFEWKFVTLVASDKYEINEPTPKILLKLFFNNGNERIIETDFSNLKKLHEEIEDNLSAFNSTYARRIETFAK